MTEKIVIFDTNALPRQYDFRSGFWLSILRLCQVTGHQPSIPEVVLHESINIRRTSYRDAAKSFALATKELDKFYDGLEVYVPDVETVAAEWRDAIEAAFEIIPLSGEDATEALTREALRRPPAREGKGARDAAIWMTALRLAKDGNKVLFVSNNTKDFGKNGLHPDLLKEVEDIREANGALVYLQNLDDLVVHLATKVPPPEFSEVELLSAFYDIFIASAITTLDGGTYEVSALDSLDLDSLTLPGWKVIGSYEVGSEGLALVSGQAIVSLTDSRVRLKFKFRGWFYFEGANKEVTGASLEEVTFDGAELAAEGNGVLQPGV